MSRDDFLGEAFLSFDRISRDDHQQSDESGQLLLPLTHPHLGNVTVAMMYVDILLDRPLIDILSVFFKDSDYLAVLETRSWDNKAFDFVKRQKKMCGFWYIVDYLPILFLLWSRHIIFQVGAKKKIDLNWCILFIYILQCWWVNECTIITSNEELVVKNNWSCILSSIHRDEPFKYINSFCRFWMK